LLLAEYSLRAGASSFGDLYNTYYSLPLIAEPSEDLYYRVANAPVDKIIIVLKSYKRVLLQGSNYLFHVMPRMLSIWLDYTQKLAENACTQPPPKMPRNLTQRSPVHEDSDVREMNGVINDTFKRLDHYMFYSAFAQLISRITHPNDEVFQTLKV
uniref:FAT domain-containing protein n=1 Tax=Gongylonema pulchrum TaxID=637853 RepID=A0A183D6H8_9BILA